MKKAAQTKKGPSSGRGRGRPRSMKPNALEDQGQDSQIIHQPTTIVRTTMMPRSPGPNTPEFVEYKDYYAAERSIHKPMQPGAWAGIQIGQEFQPERKLAGNGTK